MVNQVVRNLGCKACIQGLGLLVFREKNDLHQKCCELTKLGPRNLIPYRGSERGSQRYGRKKVDLAASGEVFVRRGTDFWDFSAQAHLSKTKMSFHKGNNVVSSQHFWKVLWPGPCKRPVSYICMHILRSSAFVLPKANKLFPKMCPEECA